MICQILVNLRGKRQHLQEPRPPPMLETGGVPLLVEPPLRVTDKNTALTRSDIPTIVAAILEATKNQTNAPHHIHLDNIAPLCSKPPTMLNPQRQRSYNTKNLVSNMCISCNESSTVIQFPPKSC